MYDSGIMKLDNGSSERDSVIISLLLVELGGFSMVLFSKIRCKVNEIFNIFAKLLK